MKQTMREKREHREGVRRLLSKILRTPKVYSADDMRVLF